MQYLISLAQLKIKIIIRCELSACFNKLDVKIMRLVVYDINICFASAYSPFQTICMYNTMCGYIVLEHIVGKQDNSVIFMQFYNILMYGYITVTSIAWLLRRIALQRCVIHKSLKINIGISGNEKNGNEKAYT